MCNGAFGEAPRKPAVFMAKSFSQGYFYPLIRSIKNIKKKSIKKSRML